MTDSERIRQNESDIKEMTKSVISLTKDVDTLVKAQQRTEVLIQDMVKQRTELEQTGESLGRAFRRIESNEKDLEQIKTKMAVASAVSATRVSFVKVLAQYWPVLTGLGLMLMAGGAGVKTAVGG